MTALHRLFHPRRIAIIGASDDSSKFGGKCLEFLLSNGYRGEVWPIHPRQRTVQGLAAFGSVDELPATPDLIIVAVPRDSVLEVLERSGQAGIPFAVLFSAGFGEAGDDGEALQLQLVETARRSGIRLLGPNCVGLIGCATRFLATFAGALAAPELEPGNVALVSQSGAMMGSIYALATDRGVRFSAAVNPGNESSLGTADFMAHFAEDPGTRVVGLILEGVRDGLRFAAACDAIRRAGKDLVVLKSGRTTRGRDLALSHTANLAGDDAVFDAVVRRYGAVRAGTLTEFIDLVLALSIAPRGRSAAVGIFSGSGGAAVMLADAATDLALDLPLPAEATAAALAARLPPFARIGNPQDTTADLNRRIADFNDCLDIFTGDPKFGGIVVMRGKIEAHRAEALAEGLVAARRKHDKPIVLFWPSDRTLEPILARLREAGIPAYPDPAVAMRAMSVLLPRTGRTAAPAASAKAASAQTTTWTEARTKCWLSSCGIAVPRGEVHASPQAVCAPHGLPGPFVVKMQAPALLHKTEQGAVALGVDSTQLAAVAAKLWQRAGDAVGERSLEGVLVEEELPPAAEIIVGLRRDATFGWHCLVAPGGTQAELFPAPEVTLLPLDGEELDALLGRSPAGRLLDGFRGGPVIARRAFVDFVARLAAACLAAGDTLLEFEANPVAITRDGRLVVLDASMIWTAQP